MDLDAADSAGAGAVVCVARASSLQWTPPLANGQGLAVPGPERIQIERAPLARAAEETAGHICIRETTTPFICIMYMYVDSILKILHPTYAQV